MKRGSIYIVLNENKILGGCFHRDVEKGHLDGIKDFVEYYKLDYNFSNDDSFEAPCILASDGHLVIETDNDFSSVIFYIPSEITDGQNIWFYDNEYLFVDYQYIGGYRVECLDNGYKTEEIRGLGNIVKEINHGNLIYNRKESGRYVR